jgi:hypothetical protein
MHGACHQVCLDRKSLNTKRLSPYSHSKSLAESFRGWDLAVSLLGRPLQHRHAIRIGCIVGKRIIADSLKKGRWRRAPRPSSVEAAAITPRLISGQADWWQNGTTRPSGEDRIELLGRSVRREKNRGRARQERNATRPLFPPELKTIRIAGPFGCIVDLILKRNAVLVCLNGSLRVGSKIRKERLNSRPQYQPNQES